MPKTTNPIFQIIGLATLIYSLHKLTLYYFNFNISIEESYLFFLICAIIIALIVKKIMQISIHNAGFGFIFATIFKIMLSYFLFLNPILNAIDRNIALEKINFFIIFGVFSTIETVVCVKILNKNQ